MSPSDTNHLRLLRTGRVYQLNSKDELSAIFIRQILASVVKKAGKQVGRRTVKLPILDGDRELGKLSVVIIQSQHTPAFLDDASGIVDIRHGCVLLFESQGFILVSTSNFTWSEGLGEKLLRRLSRGEMQFYAAHDNLANEVVEVRSLDVIDTSYRSQKTTGQDLSSTYPSTGTNRSLLTSIGVKKNDVGSMKLGLSTAAIRSSGGRASYIDFAVWATEIIDGVRRALAARTINSFIGMFATPLDLVDLPMGVNPSGLLLWLDELATELQAGRLQVRWRPRNSKRSGKLIQHHRVDRYLEAARTSMRIEPGPRPETFKVFAPLIFGETWLKSNKRTYSLATRWSSRVEIFDTSNQEVIQLSSWLQRGRCLHLVFTDIKYAFSDSTLFVDSKIEGQVSRLGNIISSRKKFLQTTKEKGSLKRSPSMWDSGCMFALIESEFADATVLICDDMPGEWADFIAIRDGAEGPTLTFVHCKAKLGDFAPSEFEVVVSQALKNLARRYLTDADIEERKARWTGTVPQTQVPRIRIGGSPEDVEHHFKRVMARSDVRAKVVLAVNFLSKKAAEDMTNKVLIGEALSENETQLAWLLTGFMSVCQRSGVVPEIWCRE